MKHSIATIKHRQLLIGGLLAADGLIFGAVNPRTAPSPLLIIGFLLLTLTIYWLFKGLLSIPGIYGVPLRHKQRLLRLLTALSATLLALQSIGQLGSRDVFVLSLLGLLLYLYVSYAKSMRQNLRTKQT